jgi:glucokinase
MPHSLLLGIEIGGTKLQLGLGHGDGRILSFERRTVDPTQGATGILTQIAGAVGPLLGRAGAGRDQIAAVGVGFGGPVDADRGVVTKSHHVAGWDGFPLAEWIQNELGVAAVAFGNDADTAGLGEARFGAGVGLSPVVYVTIGSGIGGGLILDGKVYRGAGSGALEVGHLRLDGPGEANGGGERRTLEEVASGWSIGRAGRSAVERLVREGRATDPFYELAGGDPSRVTATIVAQAAGLGDPEATNILEKATDAVACALAHVVTLLNPRRIILGGGVSLIRDELWLDPIRRGLRQRVFPPFRDTHDIVPAQLGEEVVVQGALALARDVAPGPRP